MEYARLKNIEDEQAFIWWTPYVKRKVNEVIQRTKSKYWERTHKYGIRIPKSIEEAKDIDKENGNTFWKDAVKLEMKDMGVSFEVYEGDVKDLIGYKEKRGQIIFDVKFGENFRRKARYVCEGFRATTPARITYSSVVRQDSVRILHMIAALNCFEVQRVDMKNVILTAHCKEKVWLRAGPEFGVDQGKILLVVRALYGLNLQVLVLGHLWQIFLDELDFISSDVDNDV